MGSRKGKHHQKLLYQKRSKTIGVFGVKSGFVESQVLGAPNAVCGGVRLLTPFSSSPNRVWSSEQNLFPALGFGVQGLGFGVPI